VARIGRQREALGFSAPSPTRVKRWPLFQSKCHTQVVNRPPAKARSLA